MYFWPSLSQRIRNTLPNENCAQFSCSHLRLVVICLGSHHDPFRDTCLLCSCSECPSRSMLGLRIFACLERLSRFARQSGTLVQIRIRPRLFRLSTFSFVLFRHVLLIRRLCLFLVVCSFHSKSNNLRLPTRFELLFESTRQA